MSRKVTIVSNETQSQKVFVSNATTLGELKSEVQAAGINTSNVSWYEGHLRAELMDDTAVLPTSVMYKGVETTDLTFLLSPTSKKIKSGMGRYDVYKQIVELNLQETCKSKYGKNYTQVSTENLMALVEEAKAPKCEESSNPNCESCNLKEAFEMLVEELYNEDAIDSTTYRAIMDVLNPTKDKLTQKEIEEMFDFVN